MIRRSPQAASWLRVRRVCPSAHGMANGRERARCAEPARSQIRQRLHGDSLRRLRQCAHRSRWTSATWTHSAPLRLLMTGYVNYFSATSLYAAWQAGIKPISPYVEAQLPDGAGRRFPAKQDSRPGFSAPSSWISPASCLRARARSGW